MMTLRSVPGSIRSHPTRNARAMFTIRRRANQLTMVKARPSPELLALLWRMRALAIKDEELTQVLEELESYLSIQDAGAAITAPA